MTPRKPFARISITLPRDLLDAADQLATRLDRSRSWLLAEGLRQYLESNGPGSVVDRPRVVREPTTTSYAPLGSPGLGEHRLAQLEADLRLTPEQRVRAAEQTARLGELVAPRRPAHRVVLFDRYEDYLDWKRREAAGHR